MLAHRVLQSAQWPIPPSIISDGSPTPYLDELERSLEIHLPPLSSLSNNYVGSSNGIRTCTVPNGMTKQSSDSSSAANNTEVWTWTPETNTANNTYTKATTTITTQNENADRTLEEFAPFTPLFYRSLGSLIREAFHPGSVKDLNLDADMTNSPATTADDVDCSNSTKRAHSHLDASTTIYQALYSLELYSLPRMMDGVRITRILLSLQELNLGDNSLIESVLHYCEGMSMQPTSKDSSSNRNVNESESKHVIEHHAKGKRIPILSALFHHWGNLPLLEHGLQQLSRKYSALLPMKAGQYNDYCAYCSRMGLSSTKDSCGGSVGDGGSTGGEWKPLSSSSTASYLGDRALRVDSFKMRIENELDAHINGSGGDKINMAEAALSDNSGLIDLLLLFYQYSDSTLRGKCRRWMGQWLRSFALGSGQSSMSYLSMVNGGGSGLDGDGSSNSSGNRNLLSLSLASFCSMVMATSSLASTNAAPVGNAGMIATTAPISITQAVAGGGSAAGGGGMSHNPLGIENTCACGVEALLQVLLCIIMGFQPINPISDESSPKDSTRRSKILRASHEHLLFDVLIPLHRPAGMVLWRDQTPLIGLYHEALVKAIGTFISLDRLLIGPIIGALLHPDIWPSSEGGNTPKVVLLLHEVDALIKQLLKSTDTNEQVIQYLASFDSYLIPLVSRLCVCISSENSRPSERALQFFRNKTFQQLVQRRLDEVGHQFLRALCRCPCREVPWNPTVRKMSYLVVR